MTNNKENYSDLFDEQDDTKLLQHAHSLESVYTAPELPAQLTWLRLQLQARLIDTPSKDTLVQRWKRPAQRASVRFSLVAFALVAVLLLSGLAFAFSGGNIDTLLQGLLATYGGQQVSQHQQFTHVGKSQTIEGFTLTLEQVYADANRIIVGYSIKSPDVSRFSKGGIWSFSGITLATQEGISVPRLVGLSDQPNWSATSPTERDTGLIVVYDGSKVQGSPKSINLHTTIQYHCSPSSHCSPKATEVSKRLNWTFNFSVPFYTGRVINVHQTVTSGKRTLTLERVVITPSETRLYVDGFVSTDEIFSLHYILSLGNKTYDHAVINGQDVPKNVFVMLDGSVYDAHGSCTFTIQRYPQPVNNTPGPHDLPRIKGGPWVFHFVIPS